MSDRPNYNPKPPEYDIRLNAFEIGLLRGLLDTWMKKGVMNEQIGAPIMEKFEKVTGIRFGPNGPEASPSYHTNSDGSRDYGPR